MVLHTLMPLFTGEAPDEEMSNRQDALTNWLQSAGFEKLKAACGERTSIAAYYPGKALYIPALDDANAMRLVFPSDLKARVPKGLVVRLHLLYLIYELEQAARTESAPRDLSNIIFSCIDGSGAFAFDSLTLLVEAFKRNPEADVVLGCRPSDFSGMGPGRKEIEEFEQYLLFRYRKNELHSALLHSDLSNGILPDGQAGCWGFRMSCVQRLPLTANGYEIEYDLLASALDARLRISFTSPLIMPRPKEAGRHSSASADPVRMSLGKLDFIRRKLRITNPEICESWKEFASRFDGQDVIKNIPAGYAQALLGLC